MFADDLLLFAEAFVEHMQIITKCLESFCDASGQKVNAPKSKLVCSKNVPRHKMLRISSTGGFLLQLILANI